MTDAAMQWSRACDVPTQRVAFVTLGQSPRNDVIPDILRTLDVPVDPIEIGILDGVSPADMRAAAPAAGDPALLTRLRDGRDFVLSMSWTRRRMRSLYDDLVADGTDLVVLLSTILGDALQPAAATVFSDLAVDRAVEAFTRAGQQVGLLVALDGQAEHLRLSEAARARTTAAVSRTTGDEDVSRALSRLAGCDLVVLHSIVYSEGDRQRIRRLAGKPVVSARRIIANAIRAALERLVGDAGGVSHAGPLSQRLRSLSNREREVMFLVARGHSNKEIGRGLGISHRTVEIHRARMMDKMAYRSMTDLVREVDRLSAF